MWKRVAAHQALKNNPIERFYNAGLSHDGSKCFLTDIDECAYVVIDITTGDALWADDCWENESGSWVIALDEYSKTHLTLDYKAIKGKYRLFGLGCIIHF